MQGYVIDAFISRKKRSATNAPFAFVHFAYHQDALRSIKNLNNIDICEFKMAMKEAKYGRLTNTDHGNQYKESSARKC